MDPNIQNNVAAGESPIPINDANHPENESVHAKIEAEAPEESPLRITIILPTSAYFMAGIRDFTMTVTQNMTGFSEQWAYRFQSVVDELTNNAIEFGSAPGKDVKITFVSVKNKSIEVFIEDTGTGSKHPSAADMMQYIEDHKNIEPDDYYFDSWSWTFSDCGQLGRYSGIHR